MIESEKQIKISAEKKSCGLALGTSIIKIGDEKIINMVKSLFF